MATYHRTYVCDEEIVALELWTEGNEGWKNHRKKATDAEAIKVPKLRVGKRRTAWWRTAALVNWHLVLTIIIEDTPVCKHVLILIAPS